MRSTQIERDTWIEGGSRYLFGNHDVAEKLLNVSMPLPNLWNHYIISSKKLSLYACLLVISFICLLMLFCFWVVIFFSTNTYGGWLSVSLGFIKRLYTVEKIMIHKTLPTLRSLTYLFTSFCLNLPELASWYNREDIITWLFSVTARHFNNARDRPTLW